MLPIRTVLSGRRQASDMQELQTTGVAQPLTAVVNWTTALRSVPLTTGGGRQLYHTPLSALLRVFASAVEHLSFLCSEIGD